MKKLIYITLIVSFILCLGINQIVFADAAKPTMGITLISFYNPFFIALRDGAKAELEAIGGTLLENDSQQDVAKQMAAVESFIAQKVDAILLNAVDSAGIIPAVEAANKAGIPVITVDNDASGGDVACLVASDNVMVNIIPDPPNDVFIPNTFTPNGDNINDMFFAFGWNVTLINSIQIFDRWGELMYFAENLNPGDMSKGWDGTVNGVAVNNGVYAFIVEVQFETGQRMTKSGNVTLIR